MASTPLNPGQRVIHDAALAAGKTITFVISPTNGLYSYVAANGLPAYMLTPQQHALAAASVKAGTTLSIRPTSGGGMIHHQIRDD
jgi:hypothetical protein